MRLSQAVGLWVLFVTLKSQPLATHKLARPLEAYSINVVVFYY